MVPTLQKVLIRVCYLHFVIYNYNNNNNNNNNNNRLTTFCHGLPQADTCHLLGFMVQGEDNRVRCTDNLVGCHPIQTTDAPTSIILAIFMPDALPVATLPIHPGLRKAPSMLSCIPVAWLMQEFIISLYNYKQ